MVLHPNSHDVFGVVGTGPAGESIGGVGLQTLDQLFCAIDPCEPQCVVAFMGVVVDDLGAPPNTPMGTALLEAWIAQ